MGNSLNKTSLPRQVVFISRFVNSRVTRAVLHIFISGRVHSQVTHTVQMCIALQVTHVM